MKNMNNGIYLYILYLIEQYFENQQPFRIGHHYFSKCHLYTTNITNNTSVHTNKNQNE